LAGIKFQKKWSGPLSETKKKNGETMNEVGRYKISARATLHKKNGADLYHLKNKNGED
jgi:hypothetical protein